MIERHDIGWAVWHLRKGNRVRRVAWNGKGQMLGFENSHVTGYNTLAYVYVITIDRVRVPWVCSQEDLLADDWELVEQVIRDD